MIFFIYGEDSYRSKRKLEEIILGYKKVHKSGLNLIYIDASEKSFQDFYSSFRTNSMFAEKKLAILRNVFEETKIHEEFLERIKELEDSKDIIVVYEDCTADKRTKLFKVLQKNAKCQEFEFLQPADLRRWVLNEFENNKAKIDSDALDLLVEFVGNDLWQMDNEVKKLSSYKVGATITRKDVELLVKPNVENDIFKTIDALALKNKKLALSLLHKHLDNGDNALYLLSMIAYQFRNLLIIKELTIQGGQAKNSGLHPFVVQKSLYLCNQFSMEELKKIYQKIFQVDLDIKTGKIEPELALDLFLNQLG